MPVRAVDRVVLIGCGGTGAYLAEHLVRMIAGYGLKLEIVLVDGDRVATGNLARQQFFPWELGANKAEALALRLAAQMGVPVHHVASPFTADTHGGSLQGGLVVTATDTLASRRQVARLGGGRYALWLDVGNSRSTGQAICGNEHQTEPLADQGRELADLDAGAPAAQDRPAYPARLPDAAAVNRAILRGRKREESTSCALQPFAEQGFGVNAMAALAAAAICRQVLVDRLITTPQIWFDAQAGRMLPRPLTAELYIPWMSGEAQPQRTQRTQRKAKR